LNSGKPFLKCDAGRTAADPAGHWRNGSFHVSSVEDYGMRNSHPETTILTSTICAASGAAFEAALTRCQRSTLRFRKSGQSCLGASDACAVESGPPRSATPMGRKTVVEFDEVTVHADVDRRRGERADADHALPPRARAKATQASRPQAGLNPGDEDAR